ncbi:MAG: TetR/AcrR family transcriptional regulator [Demequina sp.]|jgi:AcrR family transcriptional regulator|nr:TetR/AcrR family transcriptional regulator [Demequina sp.]
MALSRSRVIGEAVSLADAVGLDAVSMRALSERLGVVPMALYKHVRNKDELLDEMVDAVVREIAPPPATGQWKADARALLVAARATQHRHPWAWDAIETRGGPTPAALDHMEAMISTLRGGLSAPLTHQVMHALGSRLWGFSQEVFSSPPPSDPESAAAAAAMLAQRWPFVLESAMSARHGPEGIVGPGCDDEAEYLFAVDLILDGAERLAAAG